VVLDKARELAPSFPQNLIRIQGIGDAMVYRFTHGRRRIIAWHDTEADIVWVCASELRADDTYDDIIQLHERDELLPGTDDADRLAREGGLLLGRELIDAVPGWVRTTRDRTGQEQRFRLGGGVEIRMLCRRDDTIEEFWIAVPTLTADVLGLSPNARAMVAALVEREVGEDAIWEARYDWPTGSLHGWEVARLGLSET